MFSLLLKKLILDNLSRRLIAELIVFPWSGVRPSSSTFSNMNISATSGPITMTFYQKHHWDRENAALGFKPDRVQTLVSMATDSSHRVIIAVFLPILLYLQVMMTCMGAQRSSKFRRIRPPTAELAALERLKKSQ